VDVRQSYFISVRQLNRCSFSDYLPNALLCERSTILFCLPFSAHKCSVSPRDHVWLPRPCNIYFSYNIVSPEHNHGFLGHERKRRPQSARHFDIPSISRSPKYHRTPRSSSLVALHNRSTTWCYCSPCRRIGGCYSLLPRLLKTPQNGSLRNWEAFMILMT